MRRLAWLLLLTALLTTACSGDPEPATQPGSAPANAPEAEPEAEDEEGVNWTKRASKAWRTIAKPGWLVLRAREAGTGKPVEDCGYTSVRFAFTERGAARRINMMVDRFGEGPRQEDGNFRWKLAAGWHQLRVDAGAYRPTWTPVFQIEEGRETVLDFEMKLSNRLRVTVLDVDGCPLADGAVSIDGENLKSSLPISNGVGECLVPADEVTVSVGRVFLEEYARQSVTVTLEKGVLNEVTIRLRK